jgi:WD40 repeat protein
MMVSHTGGGIQVWDEESGQLHRELARSEDPPVRALAKFASADGQQARLVASHLRTRLTIYDPEAGSVLYHLSSHERAITGLACIDSSCAAPHHPRVVSASEDGTATVVDGKTGEVLGVVPDLTQGAPLAAVWKEHVGGHDRIATHTSRRTIRVWDGETLNSIHELDGYYTGQILVPIESAEGRPLLLASLLDGRGLQLLDPEDGRLLGGAINAGCPIGGFHVFESAECRTLLALIGTGSGHPRHPGAARVRAYLDLWDLGEAPVRAERVSAASA